MTRRHTFKRKALVRKSRRKGAGYSDGPDWIDRAPGNLVHHPYTGPGKDCTGDPGSTGRPGYIFNYSSKGLPGWGGGKRSRGGMAMPNVANVYPVTNPNLPPVSSSVTPKPGYFPDTTGAGGTVAQPVGGTVTQPVVMSMPGVPTPGDAQMPKMPIADMPQKGGRYGFFPAMGPLNPVNGVGTTPGPFGRIPCEAGTYNPLNPNPNDVQRLTTYPLTPPFVSSTFSGGRRTRRNRGSKRNRRTRRNRRSKRNKHRKRSKGGAIPAGSNLSASAANFPVVRVGDFDSMRYYAPTAGYRNDFMTFRAPSAVPGLTIQTPYDAKAFNQACIKTGGGPVAFDAGKFSKVTMGELGNRFDFDGTMKGLPVKFGGKRKSRKRK